MIEADAAPATPPTLPTPKLRPPPASVNGKMRARAKSRRVQTELLADKAGVEAFADEQFVVAAALHHPAVL